MAVPGSSAYILNPDPTNNFMTNYSAARQGTNYDISQGFGDWSAATNPSTSMFGNTNQYGLPTGQTNVGNGMIGGAAPAGFDWGGFMSKAGQGMAFANTALNTYGLLKSIGLMGKDFKLRKQSAQRGFNANATIYNNTQRAQENRLQRYNAAHGTNYANNVPLKSIQGWGKSGNDV